MIQFDLKYKHRNRRDFVYIVLVTLSAYLGISPRFKPVFRPLRILYCMLLFLAVIVTTLAGFFLTNYMKIPIPYRQIKTVSEIIEKGYRFIGSVEAFEVMQRNAMVYHHYSNYILKE